MKHIINVLIICFLSISSIAQPLHLFSSSTQHKIVGTDNLGNIYMHGINTLIKIDKNGSVLFTYTEHRKGEIGYIDISNPFKIHVLFPDIQELVVLSNTLTPIGNSYALFDMGFSDVSIVCAAHDNGFWLYDRANGTVSMVTYQGQKRNTSIDIRSLFHNTFHPRTMSIYDTQIYLFDTIAGLVEINNAANIQKIIPLHSKYISINPSGIFIYKNNTIYQFQPSNMSETIVIDNVSYITDFDYFHPYFVNVLKNKYSLFFFPD
jgi:hypothetical protein